MVRYRTLFLLNGLVPEYLRLAHCKELPFQKVGTHSCQHGNSRLPLQGIAGSQRLELVPNLGRPWEGIAGFQRLELLVPNFGTMGYHCKELRVPKC